MIIEKRRYAKKQQESGNTSGIRRNGQSNTDMKTKAGMTAKIKHPWRDYSLYE
jgi:hypothetical protein